MSEGGKSGLSQTQAIHRKRLEQIRSDATAAAGTFLKISEAINQVLEKGGDVNLQPQVAFLTGAYARLLKDWGVVESLQQQGVKQRKPPIAR